MKRRILAILTTFVLLLTASCSKISRIELKSCAVESVSLRGTRGADATLLLEVDNPAMQFTLSDIEGTLYYKGDEIAHYSAEPIKVAARSTATYPLNCSATLAARMSLIRVMSLAKDLDMNQVTTDIHAKVILKSGVAKAFTLKEVNVGELMN